MEEQFRGKCKIMDDKILQGLFFLLVPFVVVSLICSCQFCGQLLRMPPLVHNYVVNHLNGSLLLQGLGTSTASEGRKYFEDIDDHQKDFIWVDDQDGNDIELAFSKKRIADRKQWLTNFQVCSCIFSQFGMGCLCWIQTNVQTDFQPGTYIDQSEKQVKYSDFINKELILFSMADLQRSIPSMVDGLKPGQRKILFCSFKRNFVNEAKVCFVFLSPPTPFNLFSNYRLSGVYLFILLLLLLTTGGSVLRICVRTLSIPPWRTEFSKYNYWNGSAFCWQQ